MSLEKNINKSLVVLSIILGTLVAFYTTSIQAQFFAELGVSKVAAITIEPLLILVSFLMGITISRWHKVIAFSFFLVLLLTSFITITSMYAKKSYSLIDKDKANISILEKSDKSEKIISDAVDRLSKRDNVSSKNVVKVIDQLQKQSKVAEVRTDSNVSELKSIIDIITRLLSNFFTINDRDAILIFSVLLSLAAVFSPSFLFFTAGMMLKSLGLMDDKEFKDWETLSLKQKIIMLAKEKVGDDVEKIAEFLHTDEGVIKAQLSRIGKKVDLDNITMEDK
jgi:hypothetical protein